ncbi:MAG: hypothetical protein GY716_22595 [bacterium]|nr:hypothetical protein [bacterium]
MQEKRRNHLLWIGPLVTVVAVLSYFMFFAQFPALRDVPWLNLPLTLIGVGLSALGVWRAFSPNDLRRGKRLGPTGLVFSAALATVFCLYLFSWSYMLPPPPERGLDLEAASSVELLDHDGRPVRLADYRGRRLVVVFYRGFW